MDFSQVWPPWNRPLMKYPLLYLVYRIKTLHYMPLLHLLIHVCVCVCVCVCVRVCAFPPLRKELKLYLWLDLGNTHSSPSWSLHHSFPSSFTSCISPYTSIYLFVSVDYLPAHHTPTVPSTVYNFATFILTLPTLSLPSFLLFSPSNHFCGSFLHLFILGLSVPGLPRLWLQSGWANQESVECVMCRWVPVEVFIEINPYRDWSCLRFPCTKTVVQTPFPLSRDPLSLAQCILFLGGLVIHHKSAIIGNCHDVHCVCVCVCVCVCEKLRPSEKD